MLATVKTPARAVSQATLPIRKPAREVEGGGMHRVCKGEGGRGMLRACK